MKTNMKEKVKTILLFALIISLVGSFVLFFIGYYLISFIAIGFFISLATFLGQWSADKSADYVFRIEHSNNKNKWNNKW
ncbi:hypothetical protein LS684_09895 [Cytobacillus spongiae]|uniref:hypothetical protein n=1 Tax=Cytobacillus spongiae TaxID=2901381 RepID=UPI001F20EC68|nr:hypothetical protein [Cytobacillus spongiae]UII57702.1 hypothetical protein LS684_09895 [Cytobacillus spongiae]